MMGGGYGGSMMGGGYGGYGGYGGGMAGGMAGQPGVPGQPGMPGQPGQPGVPQQPEMVPQLNAQTVVKFIMEVMAIFQGLAMVMMTAKGMATEMGSNEEQPLRKFAVWAGEKA